MGNYDDLVNDVARQHEGEVEAAKIELTLCTLARGLLRAAARRDATGIGGTGSAQRAAR